MGIALRRPHRQAGCRGDLGESEIEGVLERDHGRLCRRKLGKAAAELAARLRGGQRRHRVAVPRGALVGEERLGPSDRPRLGEVLTGVHDEPVQPGRELRLATELADPDDELRERVLCCIACVLGVAQKMERDPLDAGGIALAERSERGRVAGLGARYENRVGEAVVGESCAAEGFTTGRPTALRRGGLHGGHTVDGVRLVPEIVVPRLRGSFGRPYLYAVETPSTQTMPEDDAVHGTVALAEHQTAGRGRLGRVWVDEAGVGLSFSVVLRPEAPVARWPELTLVAAGAVAGAIGPEARIKHPNDVLVDERKVAGILAEASGHVVLGVGVNVGEPPWPGAGAVDRDRLELLVEILDRLEQGYDRWAETGLH